MGRKLVDLTGQRFGRLVVMEYVARVNHSSKWKCLCDCGNWSVVSLSGLRSGTFSCGCYRVERAGLLTLKHGARGGDNRNKMATYKTWDSMKQRCHNPKSKGWQWYGGKGITVCDRWLADYNNFLTDMGERPPRASIERKNNELGYSPDNCVWATSKEQARNRSNNRLVLFNGQMMPLVQACELAGMPYKTAKSRLQKGWSEHDAISRPIDGLRAARRNPKAA